MAIATQTSALVDQIVRNYTGATLTRKKADALREEIEELVRLRTQQMLSYGPETIASIARAADQREDTVKEIISLAGGRSYDSTADYDAVWAQEPSKGGESRDSAVRRDAAFDLKTIEDEIVLLLHASRDGMRNKGIDTASVPYDMRHDGGYYVEAFGIVRALALLGYGYLGSVNVDDAGRNLRACFSRLEQRVLDEEHYRDTNRCERCLNKYGKDAAGKAA